jgi:alkanesulfonate monooxygenase SsuD/methylene tetrahydromethanopterin reductase-like flavin-dependent oxidoreductase (luciferase family)
MRQGILFVGGGSTLRDIVETARAAEDAGIDSIHVVEGYRSAFVPLTAIALATERVRLGTYIANAYGRSPLLTAMSAMDLDELSGGRVVLGVGSGNRTINEDYQGIAYARPLAKMREYVENLRAAFAAPLGGKVEYQGKIHRMRWTRSIAPVRPAIPVHLAAIFPKMVEVAGSVADGVALGVLLSPEYVRDVIRPSARAAAERAGRDGAGLEFPMAALIAVDANRDRARDAVRRAVASFFHPLPHPYYEYLLREQGYGKVVDLALRRAPEERADEVFAAMDDDLVDRLAFTGTPEEITRRLRDYRGIVDEAIWLNVGEGNSGIFEVARILAAGN